MQSTDNNSGLALLLVMFIVALCSMLVVSLTYSTYLGSRISSTAEKSVQAEYLLKSALNYAMVLIKEDIEPGDSSKDKWGKYAAGIPLQTQELINYTLPNVPITLEIRPEGSKLHIGSLAPSGSIISSPIPIRGVFERLFTSLQVGYEFDGEDFIAPDGQTFKFTSKNLIANLIDYMDKDETAYNDTGFEGVEGPNSLFPNRELKRIGELTAVPGFSASRIQKILPYLTTIDNRQVNMNLAPKILLMALSTDITSDVADDIIAYRNSNDGPFKNKVEIEQRVPTRAWDDIKNIVTYESNRFQVLAKVEYSTSIFFLRADLYKQGRKQLPAIKTLELF